MAGCPGDPSLHVALLVVARVGQGIQQVMVAADPSGKVRLRILVGGVTSGIRDRPSPWRVKDRVTLTASQQIPNPVQ